MNDQSFSRRQALLKMGASAVSITVSPLAFSQGAQAIGQERWSDVPDFPRKSPELEMGLVKKFVIAGHSNLKAVTEMVEAYPTLVNGTFDWGNGDFETALEGAGHMGNVEIAEFLLSKGARLNVFCAAMLGNLDFVKASLAASPGTLHSKGPHGLGLLHHAKAGKDRSAKVLAFLEAMI